MLLPLYLGVLHAVEPDHVAVVTGVSLAGARRGAWKVGLAFGLSHMLAVALLAVTATFLGRSVLGEGFFLWMDRLAWTLVLLLGLWNLAAALGLRSLAQGGSPHRHGPLEHEHPLPGPAPAARRFHHATAWLGAFFGLGGLRGFTTLARQSGLGGQAQFIEALVLFGLGITAMFVLLSALSGGLAARLGSRHRFRRALYAASGLGNVTVGLYLLCRA